MCSALLVSVALRDRVPTDTVFDAGALCVPRDNEALRDVLREVVWLFQDAVGSFVNVIEDVLLIEEDADVEYVLAVETERLTLRPELDRLWVRRFVRE